MMAIPAALSAKYKDSFAYKTVKDRMPVIVAKVADSVFRAQSTIKESHGEKGSEDLKTIAGCVSKLRNEMMTNKVLIPIEDSRSDTKTWNAYLTEVTTQEGQAPAWFTSPWLYVECYMYRRIQEAVEKCSCLTQYDVFRAEKEVALSGSQEAVHTLVKFLFSLVKEIEGGKESNTRELFDQFMQVCLWGNKCDLSISAGMENSQVSCPLAQVDTLREYVLINDLDLVWNQLQKTGPVRVDVILDNAGFEIITDLCLAEFLLTAKLASSIHFHCKAFSWFVSDVTKDDFDHTLSFLMSSNSMAMDFVCKRWKEHLQNGTWKIHTHDFWTLPFPYCEMEKRSNDLYMELAQSGLLIFKGDLNYRKLVADLNWPASTPFVTSLQGFGPGPLVSLRALKADVVTGLREGQADEMQTRDSQWMINGNWAVMSFADKH
ncbi:damage-control phosphatase ARMT1-like isoform X1 [Dreissena polymorpha]|nr:damage-control phosphatase ARMT1-like isoform X1 [Dreissena polymorpha]